MRRAALLLTVLLALPQGDVSAQDEAPSFGRVTTIDMPRGHRAEDALLADVDLDGRNDLVVAASRGGDRSRRHLRVHLRRDGDTAFGPVPDFDLTMLPDVVGFAVADVHDDPGAELVLFAPTGVFAARWKVTEERDRYVKIADADVLWQLPHDRKTHVLQDTVDDLNDDGLADLVVPEPDGYRVLLQRRGESGRTFDARALRLPRGGAGTPRGSATRRLQGRQERSRFKVSLRIGGDEDAPQQLLSVAESVPAPQLVDWDGDGRLDVLAQTTDRLLGWTQGAGFASAPDVVVPLPLEVDRRRLLDVSFAAMTADLDGDRRADYVLVAGDQDSDEPRAQVALYTRAKPDQESWKAADDEPARPLFGARGRPSQLLLVAGVAGSPELVDVDGDGLDDLVLGALRLDALDAIRAAAGSTLDAELYVYLNRKGRFSKRPDLTSELALSTKGLRRARGGDVALLIGDVTGDGVSELLVRNDPEHVRLHMLRRADDGLMLVERPLFEMAVDDRADLRTSSDGGRPELVAISSRDVLHVRFDR